MRTLEEVARRASVSRATVSRVINNHPYVREDVRERVLAVITELGYVPNAAARAMVTRRTNIIGLLLPQLESDWVAEDAAFYPIIIQSISHACAASRRHLLLSIVPPYGASDTARDVLKAGHVDGVIVSVFPFDDPIMPLIANSGLPAVLIGRNPYYPDLHWVDVDNFSSAVEAVTYLIRQGRRRIATLALSPRGSAGANRREGYTRGLLEHGLPIDPALIIEPDAARDDGYQSMLQLLDLPNPPDAVFACYDGIAIRAMAAIRDRGLRIPEDIAVIGFDDQPAARRAEPPLTTVCQPLRELGIQATELLLRVIVEDPTAPKQVVLPTSLVIRGSA